MGLTAADFTFFGGGGGAGGGAAGGLGLAGDFNLDAYFDCADVDALVAEIVAGTNDPQFDLTDDTLVDRADLDQWLANAGAVNLPSGNPFLPGDATLDGNVDGSDFGEWNMNKFSFVPSWCKGDFDANGRIDGSDFGIWNTHKFQSSNNSAHVPEPTVCGLVVMALIWLNDRRRR